MNDEFGRKRPCILVVEDDYFIADEVAGELAQMGVAVIGPVGNVADAMGAIRALPSLDAAVLDINLRGEMAYTVADALLDLDIPFVFTTGYGPSAIPKEYSFIARCSKPVDYGSLARLLPM